MRRILFISSFILFSIFCSHAQDSRPIPPTGAIVLKKLYPNPATSYITFELEKAYEKGVTITIFNFMGTKMVESSNAGEKVTMQLNEFSRGAYIYRISDAAGKVLDTGKFHVSPN